MTLFIFNKTDYPRYIGDLLLEYPNWVEGDTLPEGWELVDDSMPFPEAKKGYGIEEELIFTEGSWVRSYKYVEFIGDEVEYEKNTYRDIRDRTPHIWEKYFAFREMPLIKEVKDEVIENGGDNI